MSRSRITPGMRFCPRTALTAEAAADNGDADNDNYGDDDAPYL